MLEAHLLIQRAGLIMDILGALLLAGDQFSLNKRIEASAAELYNSLRPRSDAEKGPVYKEIDAIERDLAEAWSYVGLPDLNAFYALGAISRLNREYARQVDRLDPFRWRPLLLVVVALAVVAAGFRAVMGSAEFNASTAVGLILIVTGLGLFLFHVGGAAQASAYLVIVAFQRMFGATQYASGIGLALVIAGFVLQLVGTFPTR